MTAKEAMIACANGDAMYGKPPPASFDFLTLCVFHADSLSTHVNPAVRAAAAHLPAFALDLARRNTQECGDV